MLRLNHVHLPVALLLVTVSAPGFATTFTDSTFNLSNYSQTTYSNNFAAAGATATVSQNTSFGNPAPSQQLDIIWTVDTTFAYYDGLINNTFVYNPSTSGAISSINFSQDKYVTFTDGVVALSNISGSALLEQGGNFYLDTITGPSLVKGTWQNISASGLTASSFCLYSFTTNTQNCTQNPNFSATGGVIDFGFRTGLGYTNALGTGSFDSYSDNLSYTVTPTPEPSNLLLFGTGLIGMVGAARRKFQR